VQATTTPDNLGVVSSLVVIWSLLLLVAVLAVGWVVLPGRSAIKRRRQEDAARRAAARDDQMRYADEIAVAVHGAESTVERLRADCTQAQERVSASWQSYQEAGVRLDRARKAAAFVSQERVDPAERERALRRAAQAAHRRGDLSDTQLLDALTHRNGWDPALHPVEQELVIAKASVRHHAARHRDALDAEAEAWRAAGVATAAVRTLRQELIAARHTSAPVEPPAPAVETRETIETVVLPQSGATGGHREVPAGRRGRLAGVL
jgi:chromosome segregation ATPase